VVPTTSLQELSDPNDVDWKIDWRTKGVIPPVQSEGAVNNCNGWGTNAAINLVEAAHAIETGEMLKLSAQQIKDCNPEFISERKAFKDWYIEGGMPNPHMDYCRTPYD
tara:strand:- start:94 stop:417 length:324 start_codon:yes stop_codon:yes gene_type:complete